MTSGLYLHKRCSDTRCLNNASCGILLCVPTEGQRPGSPGFLQITTGLYACVVHLNEAMQEKEKFITQLLTGPVRAKFIETAKGLNRPPPAFQSAFVQAIGMNAPELKRHEQRIKGPRK